MIKSTELRSGNWLKGDQLSIPKYGIYSNGYTQITAFGISMIEAKGWTDLKPIPLSPSVLEAAGFEMIIENTGAPIHEDIEMWYDTNSPVSFFFDNYGGLIINEYHVSINRPKFIHQLQNLYYALTGTELTIDIKKLK